MATLLGTSIHQNKKTQIKASIANKALIKVLANYLDYANIFFRNLVIELPEYTRINNHVTNFVEKNKLRYSKIYSLQSVELKTLKTKIEFYINTKFIFSSNSLANATILFNEKQDGSSYICINYYELNKLTIKTWYLLPLIIKNLNWLGYVK